MYQYQKKTLKKEQACKYILYDGDMQLQYGGFLECLIKESAFRSFFIELLYNVRFNAYQWETPPLSLSSTTRPFQFVVTRNSGIDLPPDPGPFLQYFNSGSGSSTAVFNNLGNDARLIAPSPTGQNLNFSHIGVFTKEAPPEQQHALWQTVGRETQDQISDKPLWLNTAGGGVSWLHVRLDSRPKYYRHHPYTIA